MGKKGKRVLDFISLAALVASASEFCRNGHDMLRGTLPRQQSHVPARSDESFSFHLISHMQAELHSSENGQKKRKEENEIDLLPSDPFLPRIPIEFDPVARRAHNDTPPHTPTCPPSLIPHTRPSIFCAVWPGCVSTPAHPGALAVSCGPVLHRSFGRREFVLHTWYRTSKE